MHLQSGYRQQSCTRAEEQRAQPPLGTFASQGTVLTPQLIPLPSRASGTHNRVSRPLPRKHPRAQTGSRQRALALPPAATRGCGVQRHALPPIPTRDKASFTKAQRKEKATTAATPLLGTIKLSKKGLVPKRCRMLLAGFASRLNPGVFYLLYTSALSCPA